MNHQGYLAILSFHSLEDRIVKNYLKNNKLTKKGLSHNKQNWGYELITKNQLWPLKWIKKILDLDQQN